MIPIPDATSNERVKENAVEIDLTEEEMVRIDDLLKRFAPVGKRYSKQQMALLEV